MATISARTNDRVFSVQKWLGLNEHPDGDTRLKLGEASRMVNWRITRDGNLKLRPGQQFVKGLGPSYEVSIGSAWIEIGTFKADDILFLSSVVSTSANPGTITMTGGDAAILDEGRVVSNTIELEHGKMKLGSDAWNVTSGVLTNTGQAGTAVRADGVAAALSGLADGQYIYYKQDGVVYALTRDSMEATDAGYKLSGYTATAVPDGEAEPVVALWSGVMGGKDVFLAACDGKAWSLYNANNDTFERAFIGNLNTDKGVHFFQFGGIVYILNGYNYYKYDGVNLSVVDGYRPLVAITIGPLDTDTDEDTIFDMPSEAGTLTGEYVNRLNGKRRVWISPDGTNGVFRLPEAAHAIDYIKKLDDNTEITTFTFTPDTTDVTFTSVPPKAVNSIEIGYSVADTYRSQVTNMLFSEFYSGTTDTRIFLYGDGTNKTIYSGMDYDGVPRADYFPDQYEVLVGDSNTPITSMIRHYGSLIAYKPTECWALQHGVVELATGNLTPSIYCTPVNREKGSTAPGQVALVNNSPVTCSGTELYQWTNSSYYTSNLTRDERQARRISDRIQKSIKEFDFKNAKMWDDNDNQEFYLCGDGKALVWNYAVDAWYRYENFDVRSICSFHGDLYVGGSDGKVWRVSEFVKGDDGMPIEAQWESGAIDFGAAYSRKYSAALWVGLKPVAGTSVNVSVETDRKNTFLDKVASSEKAKVPGEPFMVKTKLKAKKFVFYRLKLSVEDKMLPVVVTNVEIRVRMTSDAK